MSGIEFSLNRARTAAAVRNSGVVVVMNRKHVKSPDDLVTTMRTLHQAGFVAETTLRIDRKIIEEAMPDLQELRRDELAAGRTFVLGVGSIISDPELEFAAKMGFDMLVGPATMVSQGTFPTTPLYAMQQKNYFLAPAAFTPSEFQFLLTGNRFVPDAIKIFPANSHGPKGLQGLLAPFARQEYKELMIMPTGGVDHATGPQYIKAIAANGFTPILGMSSPLSLVEERKETGNPRLIMDSIGAFMRSFLGNNEGREFGAIKSV